MVDFGGNVRAGRTLYDLLNKYFRPGDIFTHMYGGHRGRAGPGHQGPEPGDDRRPQARASSSMWATAAEASSGVAPIPLMKAGFIPDSISTDLHDSSMNAGMKDMLNVMDKFLAMGMSLDEVILRSTWNPAKEIQHEELGNLSVGSPADVAVLRLEKGKFGFVDQIGGAPRRHAKAAVRADPARRHSGL